MVWYQKVYSIIPSECCCTNIHGSHSRDAWDRGDSKQLSLWVDWNMSNWNWTYGHQVMKCSSKPFFTTRTRGRSFELKDRWVQKIVVQSFHLVSIIFRKARHEMQTFKSIWHWSIIFSSFWDLLTTVIWIGSSASIGIDLETKSIEMRWACSLDFLFCRFFLIIVLF